MLPDTTNPRAALRDLIAENEGKRRNGAASDGRGWYRNADEREDCLAVAAAVMELFPDVVVEELHGYERGPCPTVPSMATHLRYVLRTDPAERSVGGVSS